MIATPALTRTTRTAVIEIRRITRDDPLYTQEQRLREDVLLRPIGYNWERYQREFAGLEDRFEHFVAVFDHPLGPRVIGCVTLLPDEPAPGEARLAQMAVDPQRQGEGIGRRLLVEVERRAFGELGVSVLRCESQQSAYGFYSANGWAFDSETFQRAGIPHRLMALRPPPEDEAF